MNRFRLVLLLLPIALFAASCSSAADDDANGSTESSTEEAVSHDDDDDASTAQPAGVPGGFGDVPEGLRAMVALDLPLNVSYTTGTRFDVSGTDFDVVRTTDFDAHRFIEIIGSDGVAYTMMDVGSGAQVWAEGFIGPDAAGAFSEITLLLWETEDMLFADTRTFEAISVLSELLNTDAVLGPFEPGIWSIDRPELRSGLIAQTISMGPFVDTTIIGGDSTLDVIGGSLPSVLEELDDVGGTRVGSLPYGDFVDAMGFDLTRTLLPAVFPLQTSAPTSDEQLSAMSALVEAARVSDATIAAAPAPNNPAVINITVEVNLSNIYEDAGLDLGADAATLDEIVYSVGHDIQVFVSTEEPPPIPTDVTDRSADFASIPSQ